MRAMYLPHYHGNANRRGGTQTCRAANAGALDEHGVIRTDTRRCDRHRPHGGLLQVRLSGAKCAASKRIMRP